MLSANLTAVGVSWRNRAAPTAVSRHAPVRQFFTSLPSGDDGITYRNADVELLAVHGFLGCVFRLHGTLPWLSAKNLKNIGIKRTGHFTNHSRSLDSQLPLQTDVLPITRIVDNILNISFTRNSISLSTFCHRFVLKVDSHSLIHLLLLLHNMSGNWDVLILVAGIVVTNTWNGQDIVAFCVWLHYHVHACLLFCNVVFL